MMGEIFPRPEGPRRVKRKGSIQVLEQYFSQISLLNFSCGNVVNIQPAYRRRRILYCLYSKYEHRRTRPSDS